MKVFMKIKETGRIYLTGLRKAGTQYLAKLARLAELMGPWLVKLAELTRPWLVKLAELTRPWLVKLDTYLRLWLAKLKDLKKIWPGDYREVNELLPIVLLVIILPLIIVISPSNVLRIILGLPLVLFLPGYTLLAAIFVRKSQLKVLERLALSLAASVAIVPLIGLVLNYVGGISLASFFVLIALFILVTSAIAWIRRGRLAEEERYTVRLSLPRRVFKGSLSVRLLSAVLVLAVLTVVSSLIYVIVTPKTQESFTEFYVSGFKDNSSFPAELIASEGQSVVVTVVNREGSTLDYRIEMNINGVPKGTGGTLTLEDGQKYEAEMGFTPEATGDIQEVEFVLYLDGESEPYLEPLRLWFDVK